LGAEQQTIEVQPHPRLLGVLGDIEFAPWQCIAELVDNAFDEFLRRADTDERIDDPTVTVTLPGRNSEPRDAEVWVADNGPGMSLEQLNSALRAGWTSNSRFGSLGLYGVGFNIATARLGHVAIIKSARATDSVWTVVTLDLRQLASSGDYNLPVTTEPKSTPDEHGTVVVIRGLKPEHHSTLSRQQRRIRESLGNVYSYLVQERGFRLVVDRTAVKPRRACIWDESRTVVRSGDRIPAVIHVDERLPDRFVCLDCGVWQDAMDGECQSCEGPNLRSEPRRIWGWVGIQRYLHQSDFGIDFIRNGRKILLNDVSMFEWHDPDEVGGRGRTEYPIEIPSGFGRIIGEIHVDHVAVNYQKNAFEYDTPDWKRVVQVLRGRGPILPKIAREAGYTERNTSPIARLVAGYRRNDAGLNYLIPGDGKNPLHERAREWAQRFRDGDEDYQTDSIWYQAAEQHDKPVHDTDDVDPDDGDDILRRKGLLDDDQEDEPPGDVEPPSPVETESDRRARWIAKAEALPDLSGSFGLPGYGAALAVNAYLVRGDSLRREDDPARVPVYVGSSTGSRVDVFVDAEHEIFTDFAVDTRDLVAIELAEYLRVRAGMPVSLSGLFAELKLRCFPDQKVSGYALKDTADRLLGRVREAMLPVVAGNSSGYWSLVRPAEQSAAEQAYAYDGATTPWDDVLNSGEWVQFVPGAALVRLVSTRPESFLDGRVFRSTFSGLTDPEARAVSAERVADLLSDVAALADRQYRRGAEELQRGRLSCILLERELAQEGDSET
jgi:histidine kinase/DNA gyrase B/HSP90-like ATPase